MHTSHILANRSVEVIRGWAEEIPTHPKREFIKTFNNCKKRKDENMNSLLNVDCPTSFVLSEEIVLRNQNPAYLLGF
jgi:hypothetical protein